MELKGQEKLLNTFQNMSVNTLPHTFMLLGDYGCGKHTFSHEIADRFKLDYHEITKEITSDFLIELSTKNIPTLYVINILEVKDQNVVLKFIEDFKQSIFICLI